MSLSLWLPLLRRSARGGVLCSISIADDDSIGDVGAAGGGNDGAEDGTGGFEVGNGGAVVLVIGAAMVNIGTAGFLATVVNGVITMDEVSLDGNGINIGTPADG